MRMTPDFYFKNFVLPNYEDFCNDEGNLRKAFNAAVSLNHMTDNYFEYYKRKGDPQILEFGKIKNFKAWLSKKSPYFNDIQSVADAYKHLYTNSGKAYVTVESGGAIFVGEKGNEDDNNIDEIVDFPSTTVFYLRKDGKAIELKVALNEVIQLWRRILDKSIL